MFMRRSIEAVESGGPTRCDTGIGLDGCSSSEEVTARDRVPDVRRDAPLATGDVRAVASSAAASAAFSAAFLASAALTREQHACVTRIPVSTCGEWRAASMRA